MASMEAFSGKCLIFDKYIMLFIKSQKRLSIDKISEITHEESWEEGSQTDLYPRHQKQKPFKQSIKCT